MAPLSSGVRGREVDSFEYRGQPGEADPLINWITLIAIKTPMWSRPDLAATSKDLALGVNTSLILRVRVLSRRGERLLLRSLHARQLPIGRPSHLPPKAGP